MSFHFDGAPCKEGLSVLLLVVAGVSDVSGHCSNVLTTPPVCLLLTGGSEDQEGKYTRNSLRQRSLVQEAEEGRMEGRKEGVTRKDMRHIL